MPRPTDCIDGCFYEFDRQQPGREIGTFLPRPHALLRLRRGDDVYTPRDSDARALAKDVQKGKAGWEGAHNPGFYPHYHAAENHDDYGHVFYGLAGYRQGENRRSD